LKQLLLQKDIPLEDVEVLKYKFDSTAFITILQTEIDLWETISIVKFKNEKIWWTAKFDKLPDTQSILSALTDPYF
jgi:hypothetical protein